ILPKRVGATNWFQLYAPGNTATFGTGRILAMTTRQTRRGFLRTVAVGGAASLLGSRQGLTAEAMPETDTVRLTKRPGIWVAPQYLEELLRAEGFRDIRYIETPAGILPVGKVDFTLNYTAN